MGSDVLWRASIYSGISFIYNGDVENGVLFYNGSYITLVPIGEVIHLAKEGKCLVIFPPPSKYEEDEPLFVEKGTKIDFADDDRVFEFEIH